MSIEKFDWSKKVVKVFFIKEIVIDAAVLKNVDNSAYEFSYLKGHGVLIKSPRFLTHHYVPEANIAMVMFEKDTKKAEPVQIKAEVKADPKPKAKTKE